VEERKYRNINIRAATPPWGYIHMGRKVSTQRGEGLSQARIIGRTMSLRCVNISNTDEGWVQALDWTDDYSSSSSLSSPSPLPAPFLPFTYTVSVIAEEVVALTSYADFSSSALVLSLAACSTYG
jgi:hypothetical protein